MSKERDIDDILDSLNQLLREGESHNDDHMEEDISLEDIEAKLHELDEEIDELISEPLQSDKPVEMVDEATSESDSEPAGSPISIQRVILTEKMLINNPQGNLLSKGSGRGSSSTEADRVDVKSATGGETAPEEQPGEKPRTLLHVDRHHLEQLLEQVADDVIHQLQRELPILIKRSLYHHLLQMRDTGQPGTGNEGNSEE